jgi:hypothetical protein
MKLRGWRVTMGRRKKVVSPNAHLYDRKKDYVLDTGRIISEGEIIKINGVWGTKFRFKEHVIRTDNGKQWIDCYELEKGVNCGLRSFYPERIKPMPIRKRRRRKSSV